ncbi:MAG: hypothetical protein FJZ95_02005 [Chloroflexi bacterium]|nr:hypothetical protein [Chloroflexota bacterium]
MSVYDEHIARVREYLNERQAREFHCPAAVDELRKGLPVRVGPGSNPGIILRSDMYAELGNPAAGSIGFVVWTENPSLIRDGRIVLVGPDVPQMQGGSYPFGQILMVGGRNLNKESQEIIEGHRHVSDDLEGYMVRSLSHNVWGRVSRDAVAKGFTMETLGRALMIAMKGDMPEVEAMEVVFITSSKEDITQLDPIASSVKGLREAIIKEVWKERGYELDCNVDCSSCDSRVTCDDIKQMVLARKQREKAAVPETQK